MSESAPTYRMTPRRAFRIVRIVSAFALFWGLAVVFAWLLFPWLCATAPDRIEGTRRCQRLLARGFRLFHRYMRLCDLFDAELDFEPPPRTPGETLVLVSNHTTLVDVTAIMARMPHVCCIVNPLYYYNPFIGPAARRAGFIPGQPRGDHPNVLDCARERLAEGFDVLVFPEGTRSPPGGLLPFQRGAFEIAKRNQRRIAPLLLRCVPPALSKGQPITQLPNETARLSIRALPPLDTDSPELTGRNLCSKVQRIYYDALQVKEHDSDSDA